LFGQRWGALQAELRYFADCILAGKPPDRITPQESREAVRLVLAATQSAKTGQVIQMDQFP